MSQCLKEEKKRKRDCLVWPLLTWVTLVLGLYFSLCVVKNFYYENFQIYSKVDRIV